MNKITQDAYDFFKLFNNQCDSLFCCFLLCSREIQERAFYSVRDTYGNDDEETLAKYPCWRSVDNMIEHIHSNAKEGSLSSGGHYIMMDLGRATDKIMEEIGT